jgi:hypothetical protein
MIIGNFKSVADRDAKLKAQASYLQLQLENQGLLEKKMKDYQNPNIPPPVPPQYKTNSELEADSIKQERDVKDNLTSLGTNMSFSDIMSIVEDLRSRGEGALVKFNRNFPLIKKKLLEDINPKLINADVVITKIDEIFHKIDNTFGLNPAGFKAENIYSRSPTDIIQQIPYREQFIGEEGVSEGFLGVFDDAVAKIKSFLNYSDDFPNIDTLKLSSIKGFLYNFSQALPEDDELRLISSLPAVERNELTKILTKLLLEGILPTRQSWNNLFSSIGEYTSLLELSDEDLRMFIQNNADPLNAADISSANTSQVQLFNTDVIPEQVEEVSEATHSSLSKSRSSQESRISYAPIGSVNSQPRAPPRAAPVSQSRLGATPSFPNGPPPNPFSPAASLVSGFSHPFTEGDFDEKVEFVPPTRNAGEYINSVVEKLIRSVFYIEKIAGSVSERTYKQLGDFQKKYNSIMKETNETAKTTLMPEYAELKQNAKMYKDQETLELLENMKTSQITGFIKKVQKASQVILDDIARILDSRNQFAREDIIDKVRELEQQYLNNQYALVVIRDNEADNANEYQRQAAAAEIKRQEDALAKVVEAMRGLVAKRKLGEQQQQERMQKGISNIGEIENYLLSEFSKFPPSTLASQLFQGPYAYDYVGGKPVNSQPQVTKYLKKNNLSSASELARRVLEERDGDIRDLSYDPRTQEGIATVISKGKHQFGFGAKHFKGRKIKVGKGLSVKEEKPRYREFGKYRIHNHLLDENVIHLKYPSLANIPSIKPVEVSSNYKELISGLLDTGRLDHRKLSHLTNKEDEHFRKIVKASGLSEQLEIEPIKDEKDEEDYHRLTLLKGEYEAGNNNEKLIKELRGLVVKFISLGRIPRKSGLNFLMTLSV